MNLEIKVKSVITPGTLDSLLYCSFCGAEKPVAKHGRWLVCAQCSQAIDADNWEAVENLVFQKLRRMTDSWPDDMVLRSARQFLRLLR